MASEEGEGMHALAVPYPAQGHILPLMSLCHRLTALMPHLIITFVNTSQNHQRIREFNEHKEERIRLEEISGGLPPEVHKDIASLDAAYKASEELITPLDLLLQRCLHRPVSFILSDVLMSSTQALAQKFGIPWVAFIPFSAANFYIVSHFPSILQELPPPGEDGSLDGKSMQVVLPPLPPLQLNDLFFVHNNRIIDALVAFISRQIPPHMPNASCILFNSFHDQEKPIFEALKKFWPMPIHAIGPLLPMAGGATLFKEERSCLAWLDSQSKPKSVLYVSFGSMHELSGKQFHELALGLEASQHPFMWVIRDDSKEEAKMFPDPDFLARMGDRCCIVPWCPQLEVLSHPSVGAFLTHCGWNSIMESVACGVPMACWPHSGEQRLTAKFMVEQWNVGMEFRKQDEEEDIVGRTEIERVVRAVLQDDGLRKTTLQLSESAKASVMEKGSSSTSMEVFIDHIRAMNNPPASHANFSIGGTDS